MKIGKNRRIGIIGLILGVVIIGVLNVLDPVPNPYLTTVIFTVRTMLCFVILFLWIYTLRMRILISKTRNYLTAMSVFIILLYLIQTIKFRVLDYHPTLMRYAWYSYYIPLVMICILFLMACISFNDRSRLRGFNEMWLLLPAALLSLMVLTNDLHYMVFIPIEGETFDGGSKSYIHNFGFYIIYTYYFVCIIAGMVFLTLAFRSRKELRRKTIYPFLFLIPWVVINSIVYFYVIKDYTRHPFSVNEIFIFGVIGVIEICISCGLIPHNENYIGFFKKSRIPAVITDKKLKPVYTTDRPLPADAPMMNEVLDAPVYHASSELKISGMHIRGGNVIWGTDESTIRRLNADLKDANDTLSAGNDLLKKENELKAKEITMAERERINQRTTQKMRPYYEQIETLLDGAEPHAEDFREKILRVSVLNCLVKRGTNILLCANEDGTVPAQELMYAVRELATVYRTDDMLRVEIIHFSEFSMDADDMLKMLETIRLVFDALSQKDGKDVGVIISEYSCVILAENDISEILPETALSVIVQNDEDFCRLTVSPKGGEAV